MNTNISELLQYLYDSKGENYLQDVSPYFVQYISENHPESFENIVKPEPEQNTEFVKMITNNAQSSPNSRKYSFPTTSYIKQENVVNTSVPTVTNIKSKEDFIKTIAPMADKIGKEYGVDPNIIISQAAFESNYGKNTLSKKANNIFSIQGKGFEHYDKNQQGQTYNTSFKSYDSLEDSLRDWAKLVLNPNSKRYSASYNAAKQSPESFMKVHSWSGYAEGVGKTKEEAKQNIYNGYKSSYNEVLNLRKKLNV